MNRLENGLKFPDVSVNLPWSKGNFYAYTHYPQRLKEKFYMCSI